MEKAFTAGSVTAAAAAQYIQVRYDMGFGRKVHLNEINYLHDLSDPCNDASYSVIETSMQICNVHIKSFIPNAAYESSYYNSF